MKTFPQEHHSYAIYTILTSIIIIIITVCYCAGKFNCKKTKSIKEIELHISEATEPAKSFVPHKSKIKSDSL